MKKRGPTDVLSFPLLDPRAFPVRAGTRRRDVDPQLPIGDIVISVDRAIEQARAGRGGADGATRHSVADEVRLLAVHGALHLCGWDHATPATEAAMWREQTRILRAHAAAMTRRRR